MSEAMTDDARRDELERDILRLAKRMAEPGRRASVSTSHRVAIEDGVALFMDGDRMLFAMPEKDYRAAVAAGHMVDGINWRDP